MTITLEMLIPIISLVVSLIFGALAKKFNWMPSKYIPIQNLAIGLIASIIYCIITGEVNIVQVLINALSGLMGGGLYDLTQTKFGKENNDAGGDTNKQ